MTHPSELSRSTAAPTSVSSIELVALINSGRGENRAKQRHSDFLLKIKKHPGIDSAKFSGQYKDSTGRMLKCYYLPEREAKLMVMSESPAVQAKVYDRMVELEGHVTDKLAILSPENRALVVLMCENAAIKAKQHQLATTQAAQQDSIKRIEAKQSAFENGASFFTVIGYGSMHGVKLNNTQAARIGKRASVLSKARGISVEKVKDVRFGLVNSYHETVLDTAFIESQEAS